MQGPHTLGENLPGLRRIFAHLWPYFRKHRLLVAGSLVALLAEAALHTLQPWPLKFIIDSVLRTKHPGRLATVLGLQDMEPTTLITLAALAVVLVTGLRSLADYLNDIGFAVIGNRVLTDVRGDLYRHLQGLSLSFHTKARSGDLLVRVTGDVSQFKNIIIGVALPLVTQVITILFMFGVMFYLQWKLALLTLTAFPLFWFSTVRLIRLVQQVSRAQRRREGAMASTAAEAIGAIKLVQALSLEGRFADSFIAQNLESQKQDIKGLRLAAALRRAIGLVLAGCRALVLWYGARLVLRAELTPGELIVFLAYLRQSFQPLEEFARMTGQLARATAAGERVLDILERTPEVRDLPGAVPAPPFRGAVHFENVAFAYEAGHPVLEHVVFAVEPGQRVALVGPSGAGKSTLVGLIIRLYDPS